MKISRRWKIGLLIGGYVVLVFAMAWFSIPNAFRRADQFRDYQEGLTRQMAQRASEHHFPDAAADDGADAGADADAPAVPPPAGD